MRSVSAAGDATDPRARGKEPATTTKKKKKTKKTMQTRGRRATVSICTLALAVLAGCANVARAAPGDSFCDYFAATLTCAEISDATTCNANSLCTFGSECELTDADTHAMEFGTKTDAQSVAVIMQLGTCLAIQSEGSCTGDCAWNGLLCDMSESFLTAAYAKCPGTSGASRVGAGTATFVAGAVATAGLLLA
jgi:hypothetical protein